MHQLNLAPKIKNTLDNFIQQLKEVYPEELVAVILYGSAASGEFVRRHSNLNLLIVLKNTDLAILAKASQLVNRWNFKLIRPLFFSEEYIAESCDVFPIEFLDMQENYFVLWGKDALKNIVIDAKNLRFQCEQELKVKLFNLKQLYLRHHKDKGSLKDILSKSIISILHILRNVLRLKGKTPPYLKEDILKAIQTEFGIDYDAWARILAGRAKKIKISNAEVDRLFINLAGDLQKIAGAIDNF